MLAKLNDIPVDIHMLAKTGNSISCMDWVPEVTHLDICNGNNVKSYQIGSQCAEVHRFKILLCLQHIEATQLSFQFGH